MGKNMRKTYFGDEAVGKRVGVYWDGEKSYFYGYVKRFSGKRERKKYLVVYDDGEKAWEKHESLDFDAPTTPGEDPSIHPNNEKKKRKHPDTIQQTQEESKSGDKTENTTKANSKKKMKPDNERNDNDDNDDRKKGQKGKKPQKKQTSATATKVKDERRDDSRADSPPPPPPPPPPSHQQESTKPSSSSSSSSSSSKKVKTSAATSLSTKKSTDESNHKNNVGRRVKIYWEGEKEWFYGHVRKFGMKKDKPKYYVKYDDGEKHWEEVSAVTFVPDDEQPPESSSSSSEDGERESEEDHDRHRNTAEEKSKNKDARQKKKSEEKRTTTNKNEEETIANYRGADGNGWNVEVDSNTNGKLNQKGFGETIINFDDNKSYIVALFKKEGKKSEREIIDLVRTEVVRKYSSKASVPIITDVIQRADIQSVMVLATSTVFPPSFKKDNQQMATGLAHLLTNKNGSDNGSAKASIIKALLIEGGFTIGNGNLIKLFMSTVTSNWKGREETGEVLLDLLVKGIIGDDGLKLQLYHFALDHLLKLNGANLEPLNKLVFGILHDERLGFKLDMSVPTLEDTSVIQSATTTTAPAATGGKPKLVVDGTPLIHALARGNTSIASRLIEKEIELNGDLSENHWKGKLSGGGQLEELMEEWSIYGCPVRTVLFFFVVSKSITEVNFVQFLMEFSKITDKNKEGGNLIIDLNKPPPNHDQPALTYLCTLSEKRFLARVRSSILTLLRAGADPNVQDKNGLTPLLACVNSRNSRFIKLLSQQGKADMQLGSPLVEACELGHQEEIETLISCGAKLPEKVFNRHEGFVLQLFRGKMDLLKQLVGHMEEEKEKVTFLTRMLVELCTNAGTGASGNAKMLDYLLANGANPLKSDDKGRNALTLCIINNSAVMLEKLLPKCDVDLNKATEPNTGQSLLVWAAGRGALDCCKVLLELGADPMVTSGYKFGAHNFAKNALTAAVEGNHKAIVKVILDRPKVDVNFSSEPRNVTALHVACGRGFPEIVDILIQKGANVRSRDCEGQTPLAYACIAGNETVVPFLAAQDPQTLKDTDNDGNTPLQLAIRHGHDKVAVQLVRAGAKPTFAGQSPR